MYHRRVSFPGRCVLCHRFTAYSCRSAAPSGSTPVASACMTSHATTSSGSGTSQRRGISAHARRTECSAVCIPVSIALVISACTSSAETSFCQTCRSRCGTRCPSISDRSIIADSGVSFCRNRGAVFPFSAPFVPEFRTFSDMCTSCANVK